jgi:hypothetical protein
VGKVSLKIELWNQLVRKKLPSWAADWEVLPLRSRLVRLGFPGVHVTLYKAADRLEAMAGASNRGGAFEDHGYHIFPPWYLNTYVISERFGIRSNRIRI